MSTLDEQINQINVDYPAAGRNNSTQGFRDNFNYIQTCFFTTNAMLKELRQAVLIAPSKKANLALLTVNATDGGYQKIVLDATSPSTVTLILADLETTIYQELRLEIHNTKNQNVTIGFQSNIRSEGANVFTALVSKFLILKIWQSGDNIFVKKEGDF